MMSHEKCSLIERSDQYKKRKKCEHLSIICADILQQHFPLQITGVWIIFLVTDEHIFPSKNTFCCQILVSSK